MNRFFIFLVLFFPVALANAQTIEKKVSLQALNDNADRYFYVPFSVPTGTKSLSISYEYDRQNGANTLDLGVFDSCSARNENDLCGFRGWSGGRRATIFISETAASNGYIAGKIPAGQWRVILGLYKIAPAGVEVTVRIRLNEIDAAARRQLIEEQAKTFAFAKNARAAPPAAHGYTWFRGDLHTHTFHSDGNWTVRGILDYANHNNLDFVGITEHNTFSHHREIDRLAPLYQNLLVLRGEEVTTYGGHVNVWGLPSGKWIDFRITPRNIHQFKNIFFNSMSQIDSNAAANAKLYASVNHPTAVCGGCDWSYGDEIWSAMTSVEIWNGAWDFQDEAALKKWDELLQKGNRITAIGSSDSHNPPPETNANQTNLAIGAPTNFVGAKKLTENDILTAIENGRVWVAENPASENLDFWAAHRKSRAIIGETISLEKSNSDREIKFNFVVAKFPAGSTVSLISNGRELIRESAFDNKTPAELKTGKVVFSFLFKPENSNSYFRIEVRDRSGKMLAFTNPIYVRLKS